MTTEGLVRVRWASRTKEQRREMVRYLLIHAEAELRKGDQRPAWRIAATLGKELLAGIAVVEIDDAGRHVVLRMSKN